MTPWIFLLGRILLGGAFLVAGVRNFINIERMTGIVAGRGVPNARELCLAGFAVQAVCGALMLIGVLTPWAALGEMVFIILATLIVHPFWKFPKAEQGPHVGACIVNTGLCGGFLLLVAATL